MQIFESVKQKKIQQIENLSVKTSIILNKNLSKLDYTLQIMKTVSDQEKSFVLPVKLTNVKKSGEFH